MLKTSFPDVADAAKRWNIRVYGNRWLSRARPKLSKAAHQCMPAMDRAALCARLERQARVK